MTKYAYSTGGASRGSKQTSGPSWGCLGLVVIMLVAIVGVIVWSGWHLVRPLPIEAQPAFVPLDLEQQWQKTLSNYPKVDAAMELRDVNSGLSASVNATTPFTAASTTKLITACLYLHRVETGQYTMNQLVGIYPASYQLQQLINQSNNDSWTALHDTVGRDDEQAYTEKLGLTSFNQSTNTIDTADLASLLQQLYQGKLLNPADTKLLLSWMQNTVEEDLIPPALPAGATVYHKIGTLDDDLHDASLVTYHGRTYVWVIMSSSNDSANGLLDEDSRLQMFHTLTQTAFADL